MSLRVWGLGFFGIEGVLVFRGLGGGKASGFRAVGLKARFRTCDRGFGGIGPHRFDAA